MLTSLGGDSRIQAIARVVWRLNEILHIKLFRTVLGTLLVLNKYYLFLYYNLNISKHNKLLKSQFIKVSGKFLWTFLLIHWKNSNQIYMFHFLSWLLYSSKVLHSIHKIIVFDLFFYFKERSSGLLWKSRACHFIWKYLIFKIHIRNRKQWSNTSALNSFSLVYLKTVKETPWKSKYHSSMKCLRRQFPLLVGLFGVKNLHF